jgi:hypothetical protein
MVSATRCPNKNCQKFQLVEDADRGKTIPCLICKQPMKIAGELQEEKKVNEVAKETPRPAAKADVELDTVPHVSNPTRIEEHVTKKPIPKAIRLPN